MSVQSVFATLDPLSGLPFWTAYHAMDGADQAIANWELALDKIVCGWSPGPDTWTPYVPATPYVPVVVVPPPYIPPYIPPIGAAVPETSTWLMLVIGAALLLYHGANRKTRSLQ